jgi:acyl-coenzyme A thioesterase PaaI-like protein
MPESWQTRAHRQAYNFFPAFRGTGARLTYIADDWHEVRIKLPLSWRTRNYVGTIYGGSMYAAVDPWYMIMLIRLLGPQYIVWDKAATIRFRKPGRGTLYARFAIEEEESPGRTALAGPGLPGGPGGSGWGRACVGGEGALHPAQVGTCPYHFLAPYQGSRPRMRLSFMTVKRLRT